MKLMNAGKDQRKVMTAVARELLVSSGPSASRPKRWPASGKWQHNPDPKNKSKNFPKKEKAKTIQPVNNAIQLEDRVSRSRSKHEGESRRKYATGSAGLAMLVRGSSRRIMIMRFRPANISLINRRHYLPRLPLILSSKRQKQKLPQRFEDVDRVTPYHFRAGVTRPECTYTCVYFRDRAHTMHAFLRKSKASRWDLCQACPH